MTLNGDSNDTAASSGGTGDKHSAQSPNSEALFASDQFRMFAYKILPCAKRTSHEWTTCPFAHPGEKARRRDPRVFNYLAIPCEATKQGGTCPRGDDCPNCHSLFEYWLHPSRYRTQLCRDMEGGHCKRQVCFFAHSIEELRVPDHSHLTIPPEMQQQAGSSTSSTSTGPSTDACATDSTDSSSRSSTPRAGSEAAAGAASKLAPVQAGSPTGVSRSRAMNISKTAAKNGKGIRHSSQSPLLHSPSSVSAGSAGVHQWNSFAATPAAAALLGNGGGSGASPSQLPAASYMAAPTLEQQYAALQLQQRQMQQAGVLSPSGSMYEQQLQTLLAAESAQAQQAQQLLLLQQRQQAAAWSAHMSASSLPSCGSGLQGASPPLSPMPAGILPPTASYGPGNTRLFVPPSASSGTLSAMAAAAAGWQPAALLRTLSTPVSSGLVSQSSGIPGHFASVGGSAQPSVSCVSAGSTVSDGQDMTLASLLGCGSPGSNWPGGAGVHPQGSLGAEGLGLSYGQDTQQMGGMLAGNAGLDAAGLMLLQQQHQQQQSAINGAADMLRSLNNGGLADCNGQVMNDVIGLMMHQLLLQQPSVAV